MGETIAERREGGAVMGSTAGVPPRGVIGFVQVESDVDGVKVSHVLGTDAHPAGPRGGATLG
jgi:hypothetical protein